MSKAEEVSGAPIAAESTLMFQEAAAASAVVEQQFEANREKIIAAVEQIHAFSPRALVTMARGSSDHAATYAKYLAETRLGLLTSSAAPSVSSVYHAKQNLEKTLYLAISQSGKSPDLLAGVETAKQSGALTVALVNVEDSPLAAMADIVLPLHAGAEKSVAATKSYIATLAGILNLIATYTNDTELLNARDQLPAQLARAWANDWTAAGVDALREARNLFVIGRGYGFGVAQEAALKFKETCGLHAEAFSAAEVKHGPMAIVNAGFPVLVFAQQDETRSGTDALVSDFVARDARVLYAAENAPSGQTLPVVEGAHAATAPILQVQSFYRLANALSVARGYNPDTPPHLNKVTETL
ncbi:SIS domain-containing protein [Teredinibacter turnerae]|uniref:SIS domain-containing protein n=1 Tax=Teredinibacter turnerae TaxID=2426 RepID=UPI0030CD96B2